MSVRKFLLMALITIGFQPGILVSRAANVYFDGSENGFWGDKALVVARIASVKSEPGGGVLSLEIQAVAATETLIPTKLSVSYQQAGESLLFKVDFKNDVIVLAVLMKDKDGWMVDGGGLGFMPEGCGVLVVKGLDDPAITPILDKVKALREAK